jgi:hypothetical protein
MQHQELECEIPGQFESRKSIHRELFSYFLPKKQQLHLT